MNGRWRCAEPEDTLTAGEAVGRAARPGLVVALQGPLGAGKTVFTKGLARGLGVPAWRYVTSPTFALHNVYQGRLRLHHLDLYRLADAGEFEHLGLEDALYGSDVCVIEWPDCFLDDLPSDRLLIRFEWGKHGERLLETVVAGAVSERVWREVAEAVRATKAREERA